jgi:hypothetical protein
MWVVLPFFPSPALQARYRRARPVAFTEYSSDAASQFSREELESLLREEGFLSREIPSPSAPLYFRKNASVFH